MSFAASVSQNESHGEESHDQKENTHYLVLMGLSVLVIFGILVLQNIARWLRDMSENNEHTLELLEASERELAILGFVALVLFVFELSSAENRHQDRSSNLHAFHEVHLALSICAIFFVMTNVFLYKSAKRQSSRWNKLEMKDLADHGSICREFHDLRKRLNMSPLETNHFNLASSLTYFLWQPCTYLMYQKSLEAMSFHEIRTNMLRAHRLLPDFKFSVYLQLCMQHVCLEFSEIRDPVWILVILAFVAYQFLHALLPENTLASAEAILIFLSAFSVALILIVDYKVRYIYWYILHSEMLHQAHHTQATGKSKKQHYECVNNATDQYALFPFRHPGFLITLLEISIFTLSANVALLAFEVHYLKAHHTLVLPVLTNLSAFFILGLILPGIIPRFTLITHVGQLSDCRRIAQVVRRQHHATAEKIKNLPYRSFTQKKKYFAIIIDSMLTANKFSSITLVLVVLDLLVTSVCVEDGATRQLFSANSNHIYAIVLLLRLFFALEAFVRWWKVVQNSFRTLDLMLTLTCLFTSMISYVYYAKIFRALGALIALRLVYTTWQEQTQGETRLDHLRFSTLELVADASSPHKRRKSSLLPRSTTNTSVPISSSACIPYWETSDTLKLSVPSFSQRPSQTSYEGEALEAMLKDAPAWLQCYCTDTSALPPSHPQSALEKTALAAIRAALRNPSLKMTGSPPHDSKRVLEDAAKLLTCETPRSDTSPQFSSADTATIIKTPRTARTEENDSSPPTIPGKKAVKGFAASRPASMPAKALRQTAGVFRHLLFTATRDDEIKSTLYFNSVLFHGLVEIGSIEARRMESIGQLFARTLSVKTSIGQTHKQRVRIILTRDKLLYYDYNRKLSECLSNGTICHLSVATADPVAIALDDPRATRPDRTLHLATILKIDATTEHTFILTTTTHIFRFHAIPGTVSAGDWKSNIEKVIARENDEFPPSTQLLETQDTQNAHEKQEYRLSLCDSANEDTTVKVTDVLSGSPRSSSISKSNNNFDNIQKESTDSSSATSLSLSAFSKQDGN